MLIRWLSHFRHRLANSNSLIHLSVLGIISGLISALVILLFRLSIEAPLTLGLPGHNPENFEDLPRWLHFALPLLGACLIGWFLRKLPVADTRVGITHVITRLHAHHGHLPLKNALVQFFGGVAAIISGQSGGREGPAIHLGTAANSLLGQKLMLPNNSIRMLVGCGTSAAIAASFNTPIAGVIFAMEVIMLEYSVAGFIPVMLATITATTLTRAVYGTETLFAIPAFSTVSLWELPYVALIGVVIGCFAALFLSILKFSLRFADQPVFYRLTAAGFITGCCALLAPQVLGIGYDSLNAALANQLPLLLMLTLIMVKIVATSISAGLGLPIGLIGPNLLIGACIGGVMATISSSLFPELAANHGLYALLGMGAMMGAVLNAPLAALMALLEFSGNTAIIFPAMLAITTATLINSEVFRQRSAHQTVLRHLKQLLATDPVSLALQRTSVASVMQRSLCTTGRQLSPARARELLADNHHWYVVSDQNSSTLQLLRRRDLNPALEVALIDASEFIDVLNLNVKARPLAELHIQATLGEALTLMDKNQVDVLYVSGYISGPYQDNGIVTRSDIVKHSKIPS